MDLKQRMEPCYLVGLRQQHRRTNNDVEGYQKRIAPLLVVHPSPRRITDGAFDMQVGVGRKTKTV